MSIGADRMINLYVMACTDVPRPADLTAEEDAFWDDAQAFAAQMAAKGGVYLGVPTEFPSLPMPDQVNKVEQA